MIIKNVRIYMPDKTFQEGWMRIQDGIFQEICVGAGAFFGCHAEDVETQEDVIDGEGCYAVPGLIDLHFHGCMGYDFCDGTYQALEQIARYEASAGITAIAPATMTLPVEELEQILETAASWKKERDAEGTDRILQAQTADLVGINMEGPFISPAKKGAQDAANIISCDTETAKRFLSASEGLVKIIGLAPEASEDSIPYIKEMKDLVHISLAHTNAPYSIAREAFEAGADHAVHLYNAMPSFTHREPGVVGAAADCSHVYAELICDGIHIHPAVVRATFRMMGEDRMILISDSMRAAGMPDGRYTLGGLDVDVCGRRAVLVSDGALAGSSANLMDCMRTAVKDMGIPLETAVACGTINPAKQLGIDREYGSLERGKKAHVVLLDDNLELRAVIKDGIRIR